MVSRRRLIKEEPFAMDVLSSELVSPDNSVPL